jgi:hypothetical protein
MAQPETAFGTPTCRRFAIGTSRQFFSAKSALACTSSHIAAVIVTRRLLVTDMLTSSYRHAIPVPRIDFNIRRDIFNFGE